MSFKLLAKYVVVSLWLPTWILVAACGDRSLPTSPDSRFDATATPAAQATSGSGATSTTSMDPAWTSSSSSGSSGGTVKEVLTGPAINGVTPEGLATADQSQFLSGGSTILTVDVKKVNLPDGTVLGVSLDFTPMGTITLSGGQGSMTRNLGHFAVSRDQVRVKNGDTQILQGGFFR